MGWTAEIRTLPGRLLLGLYEVFALHVELDLPDEGGADSVSETRKSELSEAVHRARSLITELADAVKNSTGLK